MLKFLEGSCGKACAGAGKTVKWETEAGQRNALVWEPRNMVGEMDTWFGCRKKPDDRRNAVR